ncbi:DinB family protein [Streptomyces sp. SID13031]|uniref:DinB family protein n=1 Tax=Streptomyces sp. SID13031 TaxID=2706046 RepID=UPI0013C73459|nr:DinB family protein [Streptomyces sp. SID13031]NEA32395.1 DinB family protein [Streptomyces sp. SID13031]
MDLNGRPDPPTEAGEKETLVGFLDFQRATLRWKCEGLTPEQLGTAAIEPSSMTLHGLLRHLTEVELGWFVDTFTDEEVVYAYSSPEHPEGDWTGLDPQQFSADLRRYDEAVERARAVVAELEPGHIGEDEGRPYSLRWVLAHMIEEYARHNGHADLLRERLDGSTGE